MRTVFSHVMAQCLCWLIIVVLIFLFLWFSANSLFVRKEMSKCWWMVSDKGQANTVTMQREKGCKQNLLVGHQIKKFHLVLELRHKTLNKPNDTYSTCPEQWILLFFYLCPSIPNRHIIVNIVCVSWLWTWSSLSRWLYLDVEMLYFFIFLCKRNVCATKKNNWSWWLDSVQFKGSANFIWSTVFPKPIVMSSSILLLGSQKSPPKSTSLPTRKINQFLQMTTSSSPPAHLSCVLQICIP